MVGLGGALRVASCVVLTDYIFGLAFNIVVPGYMATIYHIAYATVVQHTRLVYLHRERVQNFDKYKQKIWHLFCIVGDGCLLANICGYRIYVRSL